MGVSGSCMAPAFPDGCRVKVTKTEPYARGDVVVVWFRPELITPGGLPGMIKRIGMMPPPHVKTFPYKDHPQSEVLALIMLKTNDQPDKLLRVRCRDVLAIHKVVGLLEEGESYKASREEYMSKTFGAKPRRAANKPRLAVTR